MFKNLGGTGTCSVCNIRLNTQSIFVANAPDHRYASNVCEGSRKPLKNMQFVVQNNMHAEELARFLKNDTAICLNGRDFHTLACGDGNDCREIRQKLAQALAIYFLSTQNAHKQMCA